MNGEAMFSILELVGCWNDSRQYHSCVSQIDIVLPFSRQLELVRPSFSSK